MLFKQNARVDQPAKTSEDQAIVRDRPPSDGEPQDQRLFKPEIDQKPATADQANVLIVGRGISLKGEITACDRLVVEGRVEVSLNETRAVEIRPSGHFIGSCEVEQAEISGVYEGELIVRDRLTVRASGHATGKVQYGEIELERGGRIAGELSVRNAAKTVAAKMIETVQAERGSAPRPGQKVA